MSANLPENLISSTNSLANTGSRENVNRNQNELNLTQQIKSTPGSVVASGLGKIFATPANIAGAFGAALGGALGALVGNAARGAQIGGTLVTGAAALTLGLPATALGLACACLSQKLAGNPEIKFSEAVKDSNWLLGALYPEKSGKSVQEEVKKRASQETKPTDMRLQDFYTFDPDLKLPSKDKEEIKNILTSQQFSELLKENKDSVVVNLAVGKQEKEEYTINSINKERLTLEVSIRQKGLLKMEEINISDIGELDAFNNPRILKIREDLASPPPENTSVAEEFKSALPTTPSYMKGASTASTITSNQNEIRFVLKLDDKSYKANPRNVIINKVPCQIIGMLPGKTPETYKLQLKSDDPRMDGKDFLVSNIFDLDLKGSGLEFRLWGVRAGDNKQ